MKIKRPEVEIEVCDNCHRDSYLQDCKVCNKKYCLMCEAVVTGCIHKMQICRPCGDRPEVLGISELFAPRIKAILLERNEALTKIDKPSATENNG